MANLTTIDGTHIALDDDAIAGFRSSLRGEVIMHDHAAYESARRVWNGNIESRTSWGRCRTARDRRCWTNRMRRTDFTAIGDSP
jgi:hypothetical protein